MIEPKIPDAVERLPAPAGGAAALFDADGVLWAGDVSEDFTRWMVDRGHFSPELWPRYEEVNAEDPAGGCFEILNFYKGMLVDEIEDHVVRFWATTPSRRWLQRPLDTLRWAVRSGRSAYVVSGTPSAVLRPLADQLPCRLDGVLGMELELDADGRATGRSTGIATVGAGKAERVRAEIETPILLAVGNSALDIEMLALSRGLAWAVNPDPVLRAVAEREGWLITEEEGA